MMRINLAYNQKGMKGALVKHLIKLFAEEFDTTTSAVWAHVRTGDPLVGEYFVEWLKSQGWQVSWYQVPIPDKRYLEDEHAEWLCLSFGLLFSDACDKLISWRLAHT
jgi:hypothetical protein